MRPYKYALADKIKDAVMEYVRKRGKKATPIDVEREISARFGMAGRTARKLIKSLIAENQLCYTQQLGRTFVEISTNRPLRVGKDIIIVPPDIPFVPSSGQILIRISHGASFGIGDHATTRITLMLISRAVRSKTFSCRLDRAGVLDIGTGTGILAIAACLMGAGYAVATDTDPCAKTEAAQNVRLNGLEDRIQIIGPAGNEFEILPGTDTSFSIVLANLRYPSLAGLRENISRLSETGGLIFFSGFRPHEMPDLKQIYESAGFSQIDELTENDWCGMILKKITESIPAPGCG